MNITLQHGGAKDEGARAPDVVVAHLHGLLVGGASLVGVLGQ